MPSSAHLEVAVHAVVVLGVGVVEGGLGLGVEGGGHGGGQPGGRGLLRQVQRGVGRRQVRAVVQVAAAVYKVQIRAADD